MKTQKLVKMGFVFAALLAAVLGFSNAVQAQQNWNATIGGQSADMSQQAAAFLPNEIWIHAGDGITWTFNSRDIHTVTFLTLGQIYPFDQSQGCPPVPPTDRPSMAPLVSLAPIWRWAKPTR